MKNSICLFAYDHVAKGYFWSVGVGNLGSPKNNRLNTNSGYQIDILVNRDMPPPPYHICCEKLYRIDYE